MAKTVVLIDDDPDDLELLKAEISLYNPTFNCLSFDSPLKAIAALTRIGTADPDFIFLDFNMPEMTGDKCLSELKAHRSFPECIFTVLSTAMSPDKVPYLKALGADHTFKKPITSAEFQKMLETIFCTTQVSQQTRR